MPKPVFRDEAVVEIARQALFLHEVAHPEIDFSLDAPEPSPILTCDRRQLGQALTNIVKNGVEAIQQKHEEGGDGGRDRIAMAVRQKGNQIAIEIRSEEHTSALQSLMRISYDGVCLKKKENE